jgi:hypothetical protein
MIALRDFLTHMQSQDIGCKAVLLLDLRNGSVIESCGDDDTGGSMGPVMRDLTAQRHAILSGAGDAQEVIVVSGDHTYVCGRLVDPPHHAIAAIFGSTQHLGLILGLFRNAIEPEAGA